MIFSVLPQKSTANKNKLAIDTKYDLSSVKIQMLGTKDDIDK